MSQFLQQAINGLTLGSLYGLIAIGYTMVYGILGMINFAHGDIYMLGAFVSLTAFTTLAAAGITSLASARTETPILKSLRANRHAFDAYACQVGDAFELPEPLI